MGVDPTIIEYIKTLTLQAENPIGHIRIETSNINPKEYLGFGTWQLWGAGRVPVGVNTSDTDFNTVEKIGGNKSINLSHVHSTANHTLTENEMPNHWHRTWIRDDSSSTYGDGYDSYFYGKGRYYNPVSSAGGSQPHNHGNTGSAGSTSQNIMNPYITCYMFKRTK